MTTVILRIDRLALHARHGVLPEERTLGQRFFLDMVVTAEIGDALASDKIDDSVNYSALIEAASLTFTDTAFNLIEAAAAAVADDLLKLFPKVAAVQVTVHKPAAPVKAFVADISATVERRRHD
jgi:7,8-dihydroneopterin aldolase/epimerase/oxygenase